MTEIHLAEDSRSIGACFRVMSQLRPALLENQFVERIERQRRQGYQLAYILHNNQVVAVAGFRVLECLAWGKFLYVDDLVTDEASRSSAFGKLLFAWLLQRANSEGCQQLHLDSGVQRYGAHRFYLRERMAITSHHFALELKAVDR
jgi:GNAT superfamily N-acetyltransferase